MASARRKARWSKKRIILMAATLLVLGLAAAGIWRLARPATLRVVVSVRSDAEDYREVYRGLAALGKKDGADMLATGEIDMSRWAGQLVRIQIEGDFGGLRRGEEGGYLMSVWGEAGAPGQRAPLEFYGWRNDGSLHFHVQDFGSPAYLAPGAGERPFVYNPENRLWTVVRVPPGGTLEVRFGARAGADTLAAPQPYLPRGGRLRLPEMSAKKPAEPGARAGRPDIFIYLIDALRADHMGCYGYARPTTPKMDEFAGGATLYEEATTPVTWTRPAVASVLTGLYPSTHEVMHRETDVLHRWPALLAEVLSEAGYATCSLVTNANVKQSFGFDQGVEKFVYGYRQSPQWANAELAKFLDETGEGGPVFVYMHTIEPHSPYAPEAESFTRFDRGFKGKCDGSIEAMKAVSHFNPDLNAEDIGHLLDLYDAEIYDADRGFAQFLEVLRKRRRGREALIVLVADHGESFMEHATLEHGRTLNIEETHVPLIIRFPQGRLAGRRVSGRVSLVDIFPTIMRETGLRPELKYGLPGVDLFEHAATQKSAGRLSFGETSLYADNRADLISVIDEEGYKRVMDLSRVPGRVATKESVGLWDTRKDAAERVNLLGRMPVRAAYCEQLIARWLLERRAERKATYSERRARLEMSEETREELRALGYLD